jgi:ubiquinone/menaquinone biosynthesis C-methylase UbiE
MIQVARRKAGRAGSRASFEVGLIEDIPFEDGRFDTVVNTLVMHHLPREVKSAGMKEVRRVLKPGGLFLAVDLSLPSGGLLPRVMRLFLGHHMADSDVADTLGHLRDAGFSGTESGPTSNKYFSYARGVKPGLPLGTDTVR